MTAREIMAGADNLPASAAIGSATPRILASSAPVAAGCGSTTPRGNTTPRGSLMLAAVGEASPQLTSSSSPPAARLQKRSNSLGSIACRPRPQWRKF